MDSTSVRGLPEGTINRYRQLMAALIKERGEAVSMNSLYVEAFKRFLALPENEALINKL